MVGAQQEHLHQIDEAQGNTRLENQDADLGHVDQLGNGHAGNDKTGDLAIDRFGENRGRNMSAKPTSNAGAAVRASGN